MKKSGFSMKFSKLGRGSAKPAKQFDKAELKKRLNPVQYRVTQEKATERPFSGEYLKLNANGMYSCLVCGEELFSSQCKYNSGCGWPAFYDIMDKSKVNLTPDLSHIGGNLLLLAIKPDLVRTEVTCAQCGSHLGHLFDDGPKPTGMRYCINSASLKFSQLTDDQLRDRLRLSESHEEKLDKITANPPDKTAPNDGPQPVSNDSFDPEHRSRETSQEPVEDSSRSRQSKRTVSTKPNNPPPAPPVRRQVSMNSGIISPPPQFRSQIPRLSRQVSEGQSTDGGDSDELSTGNGGFIRQAPPPRSVSVSSALRAKLPPPPPPPRNSSLKMVQESPQQEDPNKRTADNEPSKSQSGVAQSSRARSQARTQFLTSEPTLPSTAQAAINKPKTTIIKMTVERDNSQPSSELNSDTGSNNSSENNKGNVKSGTNSVTVQIQKNGSRSSSDRERDRDRDPWKDVKSSGYGRVTSVGLGSGHAPLRSSGFQRGGPNYGSVRERVARFATVSDDGNFGGAISASSSFSSRPEVAKTGGSSYTSPAKGYLAGISAATSQPASSHSKAVKWDPFLRTKHKGINGNDTQKTTSSNATISVGSSSSSLPRSGTSSDPPPRSSAPSTASLHRRSVALETGL